MADEAPECRRHRGRAAATERLQATLSNSRKSSRKDARPFDHGVQVPKFLLWMPGQGRSYHRHRGLLDQPVSIAFRSHVHRRNDDGQGAPNQGQLDPYCNPRLHRMRHSHGHESRPGDGILDRSAYSYRRQSAFTDPKNQMQVGSRASSARQTGLRNSD